MTGWEMVYFTFDYNCRGTQLWQSWTQKHDRRRPSHDFSLIRIVYKYYPDFLDNILPFQNFFCDWEISCSLELAVSEDCLTHLSDICYDLVYLVSNDRSKDSEIRLQFGSIYNSASLLFLVLLGTAIILVETFCWALYQYIILWQIQ